MRDGKSGKGESSTNNATLLALAVCSIADTAPIHLPHIPILSPLNHKINNFKLISIDEVEVINHMFQYICNIIVFIVA